MVVIDPLEDLRNRYVYTRDGVDVWTLMDAPTGTLLGDCEDFALTALWIMAGRSWLRVWWWVVTCQAMLWHCRFYSNTEGHVVLWLRGHGWIDSYFPTWSTSPKHPRRYPYFAPILALTLLIK